MNISFKNADIGQLILLMSNNKKQYIDIPLNVQETPLHLYEKFAQYKVPNDPMDIGFDFLTRLDDAIRVSDGRNDILSLYLNYFEPVSTQKFSEKGWPQCHEVQKLHEDHDFSAKLQSLYNELRIRSLFQKVKSNQTVEFLSISQEAWEVYQSILQRESREVNLPPLIAWQILQNFLFQFSKYHQTVLSWPDKSKVNDFVFSIDQSKKFLRNLASLSLKENIKSTPSKQNFAYFSIVVLATIEVYEGNYRKALQAISKISLSDLSIYSRSIGVLLNLFLTASFAYFMLEQYKESARLAEMFLVFFQKNKKYFSGAIGDRIVTRQFEKLASLLCLDYIFLEQKPKNIIMQVFKSTTIKLKEKQTRERLADKYSKLKQNDVSTFLKLFQHCCLPSINSSPQAIQELVLNRFKTLQTITLNTILQHYTQISVAKVAKLLKISEQQVGHQIVSFNKINTGDAAWDKSIMQPLLSQTKKLHVEVSQGIIKLDTDQTNAQQGFNEWEQYKKQISWLAEKVNSL